METIYSVIASAGPVQIREIHLVPDLDPVLYLCPLHHVSAYDHMDRVAVHVARRKVLVVVAAADDPDQMEALMSVIDLTMLGLQKDGTPVVAVVRRTLSSSLDTALHYRTIHLACSEGAAAMSQLLTLERE